MAVAAVDRLNARPSSRNRSALPKAIPMNSLGIFHAFSRCLLVTIHTHPIAKTADEK
jgi:hypothetical protein